MDYRLVKECLPLIFLVWFLLSKKIDSKRLDKVSYYLMCFILVGSVAVMVFLVGRNDIVLSVFGQSGVIWRRVITPVEYIVFGVIDILIVYRKTRNPSYSLLLGFLLIYISGYLYELPVYMSINNNILRFNKFNPLKIEMQILFSYVTIALIFQYGFRMNRGVCFFYGLYLFYFVLRATNMIDFDVYIYRLFPLMLTNRLGTGILGLKQ